MNCQGLLDSSVDRSKSDLYFNPASALILALARQADAADIRPHPANLAGLSHRPFSRHDVRRVHFDVSRQAIAVGGHDAEVPNELPRNPR